MKIDDSKLYTGGTYFLGLAHSFVMYPSTQQSIVFGTGTNDDGDPVACRTVDGLQVQIPFSLNYRLPATVKAIANLWMKFGDNGEVTTLLQRIAQNVIRTQVAFFAAEDLNSQTRAVLRESSGDAPRAPRMPLLSHLLHTCPSRALSPPSPSLPLSFLSLPEQRVEAALAADTAEFGFSIISCPLQTPIFPTVVQSAFTRLSAAQAAVTTATAALPVAQVNADSTVAVAQVAASLTINNATGIMLQRNDTTTASIEALKARYKAEAGAYLKLKNTLSLSNDDLVTMVWMDAQAAALDGSSDSKATLLRLSEPASFRKP